MGWTGAIVMYAVFWFICLFLILPRGQKTQLEVGSVEPGTPGGAPSEIRIRRKFLYASLLAVIPVALMAAIIEFEIFAITDFDFLFPASFKERPS